MSEAPRPSVDDRSADKSPQSAPVPAELLELFSDLPDDQRTGLIRYFSQIEVYRHFSGPLPPPDMLNLYDEDTKAVILDDAVQRRKHRHKTESRSQLILFFVELLALIAGFILALIVVEGSMNAIRSGQSIKVCSA